MPRKKVRVEVSGRPVALTPDQAMRVSAKLADFLRFESSIKALINERWIPKFLRRSGLPIYWAWAHEFSIPELVAMMAWLTDSTDLLVRVAENGYGDLLDELERLDSDDEGPAKVKRRRVVVVIALLFALSYSCKAMGLYSLSINELVQKGLSGNPLALRQAVSVDPSVLTMPSVASCLALLQLNDERRELHSIYRAAAKGPNRQLQPNWHLRYMERVFREGRTAEAFGKDALFELVTERLKLYDSRGADPFKGLFTTFQRWEESATT